MVQKKILHKEKHCCEANKLEPKALLMIQNDPNFECSTKVNRSILDMISCYKEMHHDKKIQTRQSTLHAFFKKKANNYVTDEIQQDPFSPP
jgi:hypothetical protein